MIREATRWCLAVSLGTVLADPTAPVVIGTPLAPSSLLVEDRAGPIGVDDPSPDFSWLPQDSEPDAVQSAYHIMVASFESRLAQGIADRWNSGVVRSSQSGPIAYAGRPLRSRDAGYWEDSDGGCRWRLGAVVRYKPV